MALSSDEVLEIIGQFSYYQIRLVLICGIFIFFNCQIGFLSTFVGAEPPWKCVTNNSYCNQTGSFHYDDPFYPSRCDMPRNAWEFDSNKVTYTTEWDLVCEKAALANFALSMVSIGSIGGQILMGIVGDKFGRKKTIFVSFFLSLIFRVVSAVSPNFWVLVFCQFIVGATGVASTLASFALVVELSGPKHRGTSGTAMWYGYILGLLAIPLVDWFLTDWRKVSLVLAVPSLLCLAFWCVIPESPRWMLTEGRHEEAMKIYHNIARVNKKVMPEEELQKPAKELVESSSNIWDLFHPCRTVTITIVISITAFAVGFVYSGVSYNSNYIGGGLHLNFVLLVLSEIPAYFLAVFLMNRFGRKPATWVNMILASLCSVVVSLTPHHLIAVRILMAVLSKLAISIAYCSVMVQEAEVFPTQVRNMGVGLVNSVDSLGWTAASFVMLLQNIHVVLPFAVMGAVALVAGFLSIILPETRNKPTAEFLERYENNDDSLTVGTML